MKKIKIIIVCIFSLLIIHCSFFFANAQWVSLDGPGGAMVECIATSGAFIYVGTAGMGLYRSQNQGANWINLGFANYYVESLLTYDLNVLAGVYGEGIFLSTNSGLNWIQVNSGLSNLIFMTMAKSGSYVFAGSFGGGIFRTSNSGGNWEAANNGITNLYINKIISSGNSIFAGTHNGIFRSTNNGTNWIPVNEGLQNLYICSMSEADNFIVSAVLDSGIFISTNNGLNWSYANLSHHDFQCIASPLSYIIVGTGDSGIYLTSNEGVNWIKKNQGFPLGLHTVNTLFMNPIYLYSSLSTPIVWRRSFSDIIGVQNISTEIPDKYKLEQNYPNPFNPVTKIKFSLKEEGRLKIQEAKLVIYDILGKEITTLVNESLQPGTYEVTFDGSNLPSGIYFYQLRAGDFVETKKLILLK